MKDMNDIVNGINESVRDIQKEEKELLSERVDVGGAKEMLKSFQNGDDKVEKKLKKELKKAHTEIIKDFDKSVKEFMKSEAKRLSSEYPDFNVTVSSVGKRVLKDVSGNSSSRLGDWYDSEDYRVAITHKF